MFSPRSPITNILVLPKSLPAATVQIMSLKTGCIFIRIYYIFFHMQISKYFYTALFVPIETDTCIVNLLCKALLNDPASRGHQAGLAAALRAGCRGQSCSRPKGHASGCSIQVSFLSHASQIPSSSHTCGCSPPRWPSLPRLLTHPGIFDFSQLSALLCLKILMWENAARTFR